MLRKLSVFILIALLLSLAGPVWAGQSTIFTLWPVVDYRASGDASYQSLHLLGPLFKYESKGDETEYALRPLLNFATDESGSSQTEILYPLATEKGQHDAEFVDILHLLNYDFGERERGSSNQFYLFPFLFYGDDPEFGKYAAVFPLGGTLNGWFGRDRIRFALFPLYSRTERGTTTTDNILWPFFSRTEGKDESGFDLWPIYGQHRKTGVYNKRYFLWPLVFDEQLALDSGNPVSRFAVLPFWYEQESRDYSHRTVLWPFLTWIQDRAGEYEQWDVPWPFVRITKGTTRHGIRVLPFYADETVSARRKRWFLWPVYKIEDISTDMLVSQRHRVLFFLYSDLIEKKLDTGAEQRRIDFWPLFSYHRKNGVARFNALALLDPLFPGNEAIERSWSPLWRVYQQRWDAQGNLVISVLWNLYWHERHGDQLAFELFPLVDYRREGGDSTTRMLKGLIKLRGGSDSTCLSLFYLPWEMCWDPRVSPVGAEGFIPDEAPQP